MKLLVIHGPNLNLLGRREPEVYGRLTLAELNTSLQKHAADRGVEAAFFQANAEGAIIDALQGSDADGIVLNAAAYTHYSHAIADAVKAIGVPVVEVHLSNVFAREEFRRHSVIAAACKGSICGFSALSYRLAMDALIELLSNK
ncbi:MAG: type II 3-dehydroquinate dehydratase [Clostridiales bacterium]|jgi:3-dehydroquinate dehydratase-2|nr:type II 3-dehydroquinate dehydratase [Clostridiales bacterium]